MTRRQMLSLSLASLALGLFVAGVTLPFVSSDFEVRLPAAVDRGAAVGGEMEGALLRGVGSLFGEGAKAKVAAASLRARGASLQLALGEVERSEGGASVSWSDCLEAEGPHPEAWRACLKRWVIHTTGVPVGARSLLDVIRELDQDGERPLAALLLLFSVLFPLIKTTGLIGVALTGKDRRWRRGLRRVVEVSAKWSMTDVFVAALLIVFFKAESFNFHLEAELGVYLFAAAGILSSLVLAAPPAVGVSSKARGR